MSQLLTLSRAAHLLGISRADLQQRVRAGELASFDGLITAEELLRLFPDVRLEDAGAFEKVVGIRDDAFAKRLRERVLPTQEVLAQRLFVQGQELAELRRHLTRYHALLAGLREQIEAMPQLTAVELGRRLDAGLAEVLASPPPGGAQRALEVADAMLRVMSAHVTVKPSGHDFFVEGSESLLKASLRAGLTPNYGCGNGNCGLCKARVVEGEVRQVASADYVFSAAEKAQGYALMCACTAVSSDLVLELLEAAAPADIPEQRLLTKVRAIEPLGDEVIKLHLQTPRSSRLRFLAGQRVTLGFSSGGAAGDCHGEYAIASCPCDDRNLLFHIPVDARRLAGAEFAQRLRGGQIRVGQEVSVWGPWGDFVLVREAGRPLVFAAIDSGFAPINSLVEHAIAAEDMGAMTLLWASAREAGIYLPKQCRAWAEALDDFSYRAVVAADVAAALAAELTALPRLLDAEVYLAGPADAVAPVLAALAASGLPPPQVHSMSY